MPKIRKRESEKKQKLDEYKSMMKELNRHKKEPSERNIESTPVPSSLENGLLAAELPAMDFGSIIPKKYEIICKLGKGGFGVVYKAKSRAAQGAARLDVAIKVLIGMKQNLFVMKEVLFYSLLSRYENFPILYEVVYDIGRVFIVNYFLWLGY